MHIYTISLGLNVNSLVYIKYRMVFEEIFYLCIYSILFKICVTIYICKYLYIQRYK